MEKGAKVALVFLYVCAFITAVFSAWHFGHWFDYQWGYRGMVTETIRALVKPECIAVERPNVINFP
jgi:hypothetical protein